MTLQFEVFVPNKPGDVARVTEVLSKNSVNIRGISTDLGANRPIIRVITDDEVSARSALKAANLEFDEREVIIITLPDKPGELAKVTRALSKSGLNILSLYVLASYGPLVEEIAISTDDPVRAMAVLSKYLSEKKPKG